MQINRLFEIIYILLDKGKVTAEELADRFEVSTRTIYRDVETLSGGKIPIYMTKGKGGGISLNKDYVLNKTVLTENEKSEILSGMYALNAVGNTDMNGAVQKLSALFGSNDSNWVEVDFASWRNSAAEKTLFNNIKTAIINKKVVIFDYRSGDKEKLTRTIEPLKLCFKSQSWYLYGYCALRKDFRFFKLSRLENFAVTETSYDRVAPQIIFDDRSFNDEYITVTLKISSKMSYRVYDEFENFSQDDNGNFIVAIDIPKGEWIYYYIATFGENAEVLSPPTVRQEVIKKFQKTLKNYL